MIRKKRKYQKPRKAYEATRIKEENALMQKYGLKNKREIWKAIAKVAYFRSRAKSLITAGQDEQKLFLNKLISLGLKAETIAEVLALNVEDILKRRLSTIIADKNFASTPKQARQLITHKKVLIARKANNSPSYLVPVSEENLISVKIKKIKSLQSSQQAKELQEASA